MAEIISRQRIDRLLVFRCVHSSSTRSINPCGQQLSVFLAARNNPSTACKCCGIQTISPDRMNSFRRDVTYIQLTNCIYMIDWLCRLGYNNLERRLVCSALTANRTDNETFWNLLPLFALFWCQIFQDNNVNVLFLGSLWFVIQPCEAVRVDSQIDSIDTERYTLWIILSYLLSVY